MSGVVIQSPEQALRYRVHLPAHHRPTLEVYIHCYSLDFAIARSLLPVCHPSPIASNARIALIRLVHATIAASEATVWLRYSPEPYRCNGVLTDNNKLDIVARIDTSRKRASSFQWKVHCKLATD